MIFHSYVSLPEGSTLNYVLPLGPLVAENQPINLPVDVVPNDDRWCPATADSCPLTWICLRDPEKPNNIPDTFTKWWSNHLERQTNVQQIHVSGRDSNFRIPHDTHNLCKQLNVHPEEQRNHISKTWVPGFLRQSGNDCGIPADLVMNSFYPLVI